MVHKVRTICHQLNYNVHSARNESNSIDSLSQALLIPLAINHSSLEMINISSAKEENK